MSRNWKAKSDAGQNLSERLMIRVTPTEAERLRRAAKQEERSAANYVRKATLAALADQERERELVAH